MEEIVHIKVEYKPNKNNDGEYNEAGAIVDRCKEGQQENPKGGVISHPD